MWQVPPHQYPPTPFSPFLPSSLTCFSPQPASSYPSFGPACHCGRSRLVPLLTLLALLPFWIPHSILCHSFGPACHCGRPRLPHSHCLPLQLLLSLSSFTPSKSPACHCGRSRLIPLFYPSHHSVSLSSLSLSLFSCRPARAGRHGRSKVILLTLCHVESTSDSVGHAQALQDEATSTGESGCASFSRWRTTLAYLCLAVPRLGSSLELRWTLLLPCRALSRLRLELSGFWEDSETFCRDRLRFTAAFFTKTRVVKLRLRSPLSGITTVSLGCSGFNFLLTPLSLVSHAHTLFCPPFFPPRHLVTSIYSMAHGAVIETFPVASRYRYIPNTLGRKRLRWPRPFPACVHPFNYLRV